MGKPWIPSDEVPEIGMGKMSRKFKGEVREGIPIDGRNSKIGHQEFYCGPREHL